MRVSLARHARVTRSDGSEGACAYRSVRERGVKRRILSVSPLLATLLLTGAIFLLPATSDRRQAQASAGDFQISATHIQVEGAGAPRY